MKAQKKYFTEKQVGASAIFGGPVPAGILMFLNLQRLGKERDASFVMAGTLLFTVGLVVGLIYIPDEVFGKIPNQLFPTFIGLLIFGIYHWLFSSNVKIVIEEGGHKESNWTVVVITVIGIVLYAGIAIGLTRG